MNDLFAQVANTFRALRGCRNGNGNSRSECLLGRSIPQLFHRSGRFTTVEERGHEQFSKPPECVWKQGVSMDHLVVMEKLIHHNHPEAVAGGVGWHIDALQI